MSSNSSYRQTIQRYRHLIITTLWVLFLFLALNIPDNLNWITLASLAYFPLEVVILGILLLVPGILGKILKAVAALLLGLGIIFKIADMSAYQVFARPFNPVFDSYLLADGMNLLNGAIGQVGAVLVALLLLAIVVLVFTLAYRMFGHLQGVLNRTPRRSGMLLASALLVWMGLHQFGGFRTSTYMSDLMTMHVNNTFTSIADLRSFREVINEDAYAAAPTGSLFDVLQGKDVLVVFLESYGRTVLDKPEFAEHVLPMLQQGSRELAANGLFARSSFLTSPTVGGISWLAHGTALSGLWINSQVRYDSLIMSERATLNRLFQRAGWRTVAMMPAITMAWPEGNYYGYDQVYAADDLGYQGKPFNWVTMPDQYVLSTYQKTERPSGPRAPVMTEMALISSHAPWTPIPSLIDWDQVGDGSIFNAQASAGDAPEVVWQNQARIREQYRLSIEYAVANLVSFAVRYGDDNLVILVIGDHQPAPIVTGETANRDVPVHLIARDPQVIKAIEDWHWSDGLVPAADAPVWRMDELRDRFITAFTTPAR